MPIANRAISLVSHARCGRLTTGAQALASSAALACLALFPLEAHAASKSDLDHKKWWAWAEVGGFYDSEYDSELEVELFFPIAQSAYSLLFLDIEGELFGNDMQDGAIALGYRQMFSNGWNLGLWAGPEVRRTDAGNRFWRFTAGLEMLHADYDLRFNAYTPFTHAQAASPAIFAGARHQPGELVLDGNEIYMWGDLIGNGAGAEVPLWGFDGEVGVRVPLEMAGLDPHTTELRLYGGGFYFDADEAMEEIAGPKARVELRLYDVIPGLTGSRLTTEYEYSYDDVRGDRHHAGARVRIPFGRPRQSLVAASPGSKNVALAPSRLLTRQERRMLDGLEREDIFTTRGKLEREQVADEHTDVVFDKVAYVGDGGDLSGTSHDQGANTLVIVNGVVETQNGNNTIHDHQTVQGGQSTIPVYGVRSGTVANFTAPGAPAFVRSTDDSDVIALTGNRTHIAGLDIDGDGRDGHGINVGDGKWNIAIDQNRVHDIGPPLSDLSDGVHLGDGNSHIWIFNNYISDVSDNAIELVSNNNDVRVMDIVINTIGSNDAGIYIRDNNTAITISDVAITDSNADGIQIRGENGGNQVDISNVRIESVGVSGIGIWYDNTVTISNATILDVARSGPAAGITMLGTVLVGGAGGDRGNTVTIADTTISDSRQNGILAYANNEITVTNTIITNSAFGGITIGLGDPFGSNHVTISNSTIDGAGEIGLVVRGNNPNTIIMTDTTFTGDFGDDVIDIDAAGNMLSGGGNVFDGDGTFGDQFCEVTGVQLGPGFDFDVGPVGGNAGPGVGGGPAFNCPGDVP